MLFHMQLIVHDERGMVKRTSTESWNSHDIPYPFPFCPCWPAVFPHRVRSGSLTHWARLIFIPKFKPAEICQLHFPHLFISRCLVAD